MTDMLQVCHLLLLLGTILLVNGATPYSVQDFCSGDILKINYDGRNVNCGDELLQADTADKPSIYFHEANQGEKYTLIMADPDAPGANDWRHFLVADILGEDLQSGQLGGQILTEYQGPSPPAGSGVHRYHFWLYKQNEEYPLHIPSSRNNWDVDNFAKKAGLDDLVATFQYQVKNN